MYWRGTVIGTGCGLVGGLSALHPSGTILTDLSKHDSTPLCPSALECRGSSRKDESMASVLDTISGKGECHAETELEGKIHCSRMDVWTWATCNGEEWMTHVDEPTRGDETSPDC